MAGDWIKMGVNLPDKPEVWHIAGALGIDADSVVGKLLRVWAWFDAHTENGNAAGVSYSLVDRVAGVAGFAEAMALSGWLLQNGSVLSCPNFERHNGKTAKNRALTNERVAKHRKSNDDSNVHGNAAAVTKRVTKTVTREEKRREEEIPSVAKATDGDAVEATRAELWAAGKSLLAEQGMPKSQCGSFVGKLVSDYGDAVVVEAVRAAVVARPADAAGYIKAACLHAVGKRKQPESFAEQGARLARERVNAFAPAVAIQPITEVSHVTAIAGR